MKLAETELKSGVGRLGYVHAQSQLLISSASLQYLPYYSPFRDNTFGKPDAEIYRSVVVEKLSPKVQLINTILMLVLFGAHHSYCSRLQNVRVKGMVYVADFRELLQNLLAEWSGT